AREKRRQIVEHVLVRAGRRDVQLLGGAHAPRHYCPDSDVRKTSQYALRARFGPSDAFSGRSGARSLEIRGKSKSPCAKREVVQGRRLTHVNAGPESSGSCFASSACLRFVRSPAPTGLADRKGAPERIRGSCMSGTKELRRIGRSGRPFAYGGVGMSFTLHA